MVGWIYKEDHYTLLHTKYKSSGPCGFGEDLCFSHDTPRGGARMDPRGTYRRIHKEDHYTLLHTKYESSGPCGSEKIFFFIYFFHDAHTAGPVWTPWTRLTGFIKRTTIHCYTQNMKALGLVVSDKKIFLCFFSPLFVYGSY